MHALGAASLILRSQSTAPPLTSHQVFEASQRSRHQIRMWPPLVSQAGALGLALLTSVKLQAYILSLSICIEDQRCVRGADRSWDSCKVTGSLKKTVEH